MSNTNNELYVKITGLLAELKSVHPLRHATVEQMIALIEIVNHNARGRVNDVNKINKELAEQKALNDVLTKTINLVTDTIIETRDDVTKLYAEIDDVYKDLNVISGECGGEYIFVRERDLHTIETTKNVTTGANLTGGQSYFGYMFVCPNCVWLRAGKRTNPADFIKYSFAQKRFTKVQFGQIEAFRI